MGLCTWRTFSLPSDDVGINRLMNLTQFMGGFWFEGGWLRGRFKVSVSGGRLHDVVILLDRSNVRIILPLNAWRVRAKNNIALDRDLALLGPIDPVAI